MDEVPHHLRVFLCHSFGDKPIVRELYKRLHSDGFKPWLDEEDLLPGHNWEQEIPKAVRTSDVIIVCLSRDSISKRGYVQKEIKFALDSADEQPEGTIFLIPLKLEECDLPEQFKRWHSVSLFEERGYERLIRALQHRADTRMHSKPLADRLYPPVPDTAGILQAGKEVSEKRAQLGPNLINQTSQNSEHKREGALDFIRARLEQWVNSLSTRTILLIVLPIGPLLLLAYVALFWEPPNKVVQPPVVLEQRKVDELNARQVVTRILYPAEDKEHNEKPTIRLDARIMCPQPSHNRTRGIDL